MEDPIVDGSISPTIIADSISRTTDDIDIDLTLITEDKLVKESESNHIIVNSSPLSSAKSREISPVLEVAQANDKVITNTRIVCSHGMANPSEAKDMKRIGQVSRISLTEFLIISSYFLLIPKPLFSSARCDGFKRVRS